jgi:hypothetical protein
MRAHTHGRGQQDLKTALDRRRGHRVHLDHRERDARLDVPAVEVAHCALAERKHPAP